MTSNENNLRQQRERMLDRFAPGGESASIENATEREMRLNQLPPGEKELALESARLADLCQYFSQEKMDLPADLLERIEALARMQPAERVRELLSINQALIEYLDRVGSGPQLWQ